MRNLMLILLPLMAAMLLSTPALAEDPGCDSAPFSKLEAEWMENALCECWGEHVTTTATYHKDCEVSGVAGQELCVYTVKKIVYKRNPACFFVPFLDACPNPEILSEETACSGICRLGMEFSDMVLGGD